MKLLILSALILVGAGNTWASDTVLTSTESLNETDTYCWRMTKKMERSKQTVSFSFQESEFYELKRTTETVEIFAEGKDWYLKPVLEYTKFRKVYYPIEKTECFEWEPGYLSGRCRKEWVLFKGGRIAWRHVK